MIPVHIQKRCTKCRMQRAYDWIQGMGYSENLTAHGWQWIKGRWICPDCIERGRNDLPIRA